MFRDKKLNFIFIFFATLLFAPIFLGVNIAKAKNTNSEPVSIKIFHSSTCHACISELSFLENLKGEYEDKIKIEKYNFANKENKNLLQKKLKKRGAMNYYGVVPITFANGVLFKGFSKNTTGAKIKEVINNKLEGEETSAQNISKEFNLPFIGKINPEKYSLPALAVILGFLDGFNVCSLGALALILGLVLALGSRKKIILYGGGFVLITSIIYGLLIVLWYKVFSTLSAYMIAIETLVAMIGIAGGIYCFKEFINQRKYGATCQSIGSKLVSKLSSQVNNSFKGNATSLGILGSILAFATILTIVEFPCSAATPVTFSAILAGENLSPALYFFYIALFVFLYMIDEIVILIIAAYKMELWLTSDKFTQWATLAEAIILTLIGLYYLQGIIPLIF